MESGMIVHKKSAPASPAPAPVSAPAAPATYSNADKARQDELSSRSSAYTSKTVTAGGQVMDRPEAITLAGIVSQLADESRAVSGVPNGTFGGLQGPRVPGAGAGR
jgi:hypothetical protein